MKYPTGTKNPTRSGLYKKKMLPKTKNPKRVSHNMREHRQDMMTNAQRRKAVTKALST